MDNGGALLHASARMRKTDRQKDKSDQQDK